jgi:transposase
MVLHAGLDLSRKRLDYCLLDQAGDRVEVAAASPDADGLDRLARRVEQRFGPMVEVRAAIESMTGARLVHDTLERCGWEVEVADAVKVKGLAPLACKTDKIDAWVLAELSRRRLVPAIWLPDFQVRQERERARSRLHLVKHRSMLKQRVHSALMCFGHACPVSDLFGIKGRELLERLDFPDPWRSNVLAAVALIDDLDRQVTAIERELRRLGADHACVSLSQTVPGVAWVLGYTIAAEIGDITRFPSPTKLAGRGRDREISPAPTPRLTRAPRTPHTPNPLDNPPSFIERGSASTGSRQSRETAPRPGRPPAAPRSSARDRSRPRGRPHRPPGRPAPVAGAPAPV